MAIDRGTPQTPYPGRRMTPLLSSDAHSSYTIHEAKSYLNKRLAKYQLTLSEPNTSQLLTALPQEEGVIPRHLLEETIWAIINKGPEPFTYNGISIQPNLLESDVHETEPTLLRDTSTDQHLLKLYIKEIKRIPLLTPQEELTLSRSIHHPHTTPLARQYAFHEFVSRNLRLVVKIAKVYEPKTTIPIMDLIQEGNQGLFRAVDHYNPELGFRFSTYATWWIRQFITRCMSDQKGIIRIPDYLNQYITKIKTFKKAYIQERGEPPSLKETSDALSIPIPLLKVALSVKNPVSISQKVRDTDSDSTLEDHIMYQPVQPGHIAKQAAIQDVFQEFTPRERVILCLRYGLYHILSLEDLKAVCQKDVTIQDLSHFKSGSHTQGLTLEEIGSLIPNQVQEKGLTRERVRQIEQKALLMLKHPSRSKRLREFYFDEEDNHFLL